MSQQTTVLCIFGGNSTEYEVSCDSAVSVLKNIDYNKYNVIKAGIKKDGEWFIYDGEIEKIGDKSWIYDSANLFPCAIVPKGVNKKTVLVKFNMNEKSFETIDFDVIFPVIHGANGEDGSVQGLGMLYDVAVCGADVIGSVLSFDKSLTKIICETVQIPQAKYIVLKKQDCRTNADVIKIESVIPYPVFIKPAKAGSSVGIAKAFNRNELTKGIENAFKYDSTVIAEEFVKGQEVEISVMGNDKSDIKIAVCGEINPNAEFYDYDTKYVNDTAEYFIPARVNSETSAKITEYAQKVYAVLGVEGFARIDFFVRENGEIVFNEINTIPGFTSISMFAKLFSYSGIQYSKCIDYIIELALKRHHKCQYTGGES